MPFNDFVDHLRNMEELKHEKGTKDAIVGLKSLIRGRRVNNNSSGKTKIAGSLVDRIGKR